MNSFTTGTTAIYPTTRTPEFCSNATNGESVGDGKNNITKNQVTSTTERQSDDNNISESAQSVPSQNQQSFDKHSSHDAPDQQDNLLEDISCDSVQNENSDNESLLIMHKSNSKLHHSQRTHQPMYRQNKAGQLDAEIDDECRSLKSIGFDDVLTASLRDKLKTSRSNEIWNTMFEELKQYKQINYNLHSIGKSNTKLYEWQNRQQRMYWQYKAGQLDAEKDAEKLKRCRILESIGFNDVLTASRRHKLFKTSRWNDMFEELKQYKQTNNRIYVHSKSNIKLHKWQRYQQLMYRQYKAGQLDAEADAEKLERCRLLESIGFDDVLTASRRHKRRTSIWNDMFEELKQYKQTNNTIYVNSRQNSNLNNWQQSQQPMYRQYKAGQLDAEKDAEQLKRCRLLESIGFDDVLTTASRRDKLKTSRLNEQRNGIWNDMFEELKQYKQTNNNLHVHGKSSQKLQNWKQNQQPMYWQYKAGQLDAETDAEKLKRCRLLESIGFDNVLTTASRRDKLRTSIWNDMFEELKQYKQTNNDLHVNYKSNSKLYHWRRSQQPMYRQYKAGQLDAETDAEKLERCRLLESIGFDDVLTASRQDESTSHEPTDLKTRYGQMTRSKHQVNDIDLQGDLSNLTKRKHMFNDSEMTLDECFEGDNFQNTVSGDTVKPICVVEDVERPADVCVTVEDYEFMQSGLSWGVWM